MVRFLCLFSASDSFVDVGRTCHEGVLVSSLSLALAMPELVLTVTLNCLEHC